MSNIKKEINFNQIAVVLLLKKKAIGLVSCIALVFAIVYCLFATPVFTAQVLINPPKLSDAGTNFSQLITGLSALGSGGGGLLNQKTDADITIAMMRTNVVKDMVINKFNLLKKFKFKDMELARRAMDGIVQFTPDLKSGFVEVDVDSTDPVLAAEIANYYTVALGQAINNVAYNRANQRYQFYQDQLKGAVRTLSDAESALRMFNESNGILAGQQAQVIAGISTQLQAQLVSAQMQLQNMAYYASPENPDYKIIQVRVDALKKQLNDLNSQNSDENIPIPAGLAPKLASQYVSLIRELRFRELVYEVMLKQAKSAQLDAQSELVPLAIQVVDPAVVPIYKSKPKRLKIILQWFILSLIGSCAYFIFQNRKKILVVAG